MHFKTSALTTHSKKEAILGKLNKLEAASLFDWASKKLSPGDMTVRAVVGKLVNRQGVATGTLQDVTDQGLAALRDKLPSGRLATVHSPVLHHIRQLCKAELASRSEPSANFRMMSHMNLERAGLRDARAGQIARYNEKGLKMDTLRGTHVWRNSSSGDLIIVGTWAQVSHTIAAGGTGLKFVCGMGDSRAGAADYDFDRMFGSQFGETDTEVAATAKMSLYVEVTSGVGVQETEDDYEVVLNAPGQIVEAVGNKLVGIAGAAGPESLGNKVLDGIAEAKGILEDQVIPVGEQIQDVRTARKEAKIKKTHLTVRIGIGASGRNYKEMGEEFTGAELSAAVNELRRSA